MPNLNAALGCAQLEQLNGFLARKRALARAMRRRSIKSSTSGSLRAGLRQEQLLAHVILLDPAAADARDTVLAATNGAGLETRPAWTLMHRLRVSCACPATTFRWRIISRALDQTSKRAGVVSIRQKIAECCFLNSIPMSKGPDAIYRSTGSRRSASLPPTCRRPSSLMQNNSHPSHGSDRSHRGPEDFDLPGPARICLDIGPVVPHLLELLYLHPEAKVTIGPRCN
jgi:hypothetical protein